MYACYLQQCSFAERILSLQSTNSKYALPCSRFAPARKISARIVKPKSLQLKGLFSVRNLKEK